MSEKTEKSDFCAYEARRIGEYSESSLHRALKLAYADSGSAFEVSKNGKIIDLVTSTGLCVEIQTGSFGSIRKKIVALAKKEKVLLVHPIYARKTIVTLEPGGEIRSERASPKKETILNVFDELVHAPELIGLKNLSIDLCLAHVRDIRVDDGKGSWRRKGISSLDRELISVTETFRLTTKTDYGKLLPFAKGEEFTNKSLAKALGIKKGLASKMTNCLKKAGVIRETEKRGRELVFTK